MLGITYLFRLFAAQAASRASNIAISIVMAIVRLGAHRVHEQQHRHWYKMEEPPQVGSGL